MTNQIARPGQTRTLPAGLVEDFGGLIDFLHLTLTDAAGAKVDLRHHAWGVRRRMVHPCSASWLDLVEVFFSILAELNRRAPRRPTAS